MKVADQSGHGQSDSGRSMYYSVGVFAKSREHSHLSDLSSRARRTGGGRPDASLSHARTSLHPLHIFIVDTRCVSDACHAAERTQKKGRSGMGKFWVSLPGGRTRTGWVSDPVTGAIHRVPTSPHRVTWVEDQKAYLSYLIKVGGYYGLRQNMPVVPPSDSTTFPPSRRLDDAPTTTA